jgi:hypothetical protein
MRCVEMCCACGDASLVLLALAARLPAVAYSTITVLGNESTTQGRLWHVCALSCEWNVFKRLHQAHGAGGLDRFDQILIEMHFSTALRFSPRRAAEDAPSWDALVKAAGLVAFHTSPEFGAVGERTVHPTLVEAGLLDHIAGMNYHLVRLETLRAGYGRPRRRTLSQLTHMLNMLKTCYRGVL